MVRFRNQSIDPSLDLPYKTFLVPRLTGTEFCALNFILGFSISLFKNLCKIIFSTPFKASSYQIANK